jgi:hypothetical protein
MQSTAPLVGVAVGNKRHFFTIFVQMQVAMCVGALVCYLMGRLVTASSSLASVYYPGAYLYTVGDVFFLVTPVVVWMLFRGYGWRHGMEMAIAMITPVAAIALLGELAGYAYRSWLITAGYPAMSVGMLVCMLYRPLATGAPHVNAATRAMPSDRTDHSRP